MNKKLLALLAVAAVGVSVAGATPQTHSIKVSFKLILVRLILKQKLKLGLLMQNGTLMAV